MTDIAVVWNGTQGDIALQGDDLLVDDGLVTAVIITLCSDARADADVDVGNGLLARRGWWAADTSGWGSLLWLMQREKVTQETVEKARDYARRALQWLVDDGVVSAVDVTAEIMDRETIELYVQLTRGSNLKYDYLWRAMENTSRSTYAQRFMLRGGTVVAA